MRDVQTFYRRYIGGHDSLQYESVFAKAGLVLSRAVVTVPFVGVSTGTTPAGALQVQMVTPGSSAEAAGVEPGDVLTAIGDVPVTADADWGTTFRNRYRGKSGQPLTIPGQRRGPSLHLNRVGPRRTNPHAMA